MIFIKIDIGEEVAADDKEASKLRIEALEGISEKIRG